MLRHVPKKIHSRGRIYTTRDERESLGITSSFTGHGETVDVGLVTVDRSVEWGTYGQSATLRKTLGADGEIHVPQRILDTLDLERGDVVRMTMQLV